MPSSRRLGVALLSLALASSWLAAQPPRKEEEEDPKAKEKSRPVVPVPVTEPDKKDAPGPDAADPDDIGTFKDEMRRADHAEARNLFKALAIPYDRLEANFQGGATFRVELIPFRELPEGEFEIKVLDLALATGTPKTLKTGSGYKFVPFEMIVLEQVDNFLNKKTETLDRVDKLDYAARAVAAGLRWHLLAVTNNKRVGKAWGEVEAELKRRHVKLKREQFEILLKDKLYEKADAIGVRLLTRYPDNFDVKKDVYRLQLLRTYISKKEPTDSDLVKLRESLLLYDRLPGNKDEDLLNKVRSRLKDRATALMALSNADAKKGMHAEALAKLRTAELLDPDLPGIAEARTRLGGKVLYVGVSKLPELMSPATATTDPEKWAVELMFEGLLQSVPDPEVIRYRPVLAESLPVVMPLGRSFTLPKDVRWARDGMDTLDAVDVKGTLDLLQKSGHRERWCADGLEVFHAIDRIDESYRLRLAYNQGVLEPLSRATFKVIPARYLKDLGKNADDAAFAKAPFGTGPFRYEGREREGMNRECAVFRANPYYGQRPGKFGLPWIREIRMYVPDQSTLVKDVAAGQLHLYPDAPYDLAVRFRGDAGLKENLRVSTAQANRRIHILAINHKQSALQNDKLRQGLSAAIDRKAILDEQFRAGNQDAHVALTGPFPAKCWATPPRSAALHRRGSGGLFAEALGGRTIHLRLAFQADDPKNAQVCTMVKKQIEEATADKSGKPAVTIDLVAMPSERFRVKLHQECDYDLALTTFDYRDDLYSLASFLDPDVIPRDGREGRNYLNYLAPGANPTDADRRLRQTIEKVRVHRDFNKEVKEKTWDIHSQFNLRVPFVPLWQLDRSMVAHRDLELYLDHPESPVQAERLDPAVVFTGVEMWRLR